MVTFEQAISDELRQEFRQLLLEAAQRLTNQGDPLWYPEDLTDEKLFAHGEPYLCLVDGVKAGTFILVDKDPLFWPEITDDSTTFVHKFAVGEQFRGTGLSFRMLDFAKQQAMAKGKAFLRLDCRSERLKLRAVYESYGFTFVGLTYLIDKTNALYEIKL